MLHKTFGTVKATTGEAGAFVALVSTYTEDRQGERVKPGAFSKSLARWRQSGRMVPVLADHDGKVGAVVGRIDPRLTEETERGLEATGTLDLSTELGRRVYDLVKSGSLSWSIGFTVPDGGRRRRGKVTELTEIDLVEVSAVATPANREARTLAIKSLDEHRAFRETLIETLAHAGSDEDLRERGDALVKSVGIDLRPIRIETFRC